MSGHICMQFHPTAVTIGLNVNWKFGKDPWMVCGPLVQCRPSFLKYKLVVTPYNSSIVAKSDALLLSPAPLINVTSHTVDILPALTKVVLDISFVCQPKTILGCTGATSKVVSTSRVISAWSKELLKGVTSESRIVFEELKSTDLALNVSFSYSYSVQEGLNDNCTATNGNATSNYCPYGWPFSCTVFTTPGSNSTPCCNDDFHPTCRYTAEQITTSATATFPETTNVAVITTSVVMTAILIISVTGVVIVCRRKNKRAVLEARNAERLRLNSGLTPPTPELMFINRITWYCRRLLTAGRNSPLPANQLHTEEIFTSL